ncbi:hypothetical protein KC327_g18068 [Hortaea werneckii]|nr:hypothetical protein KC329_g18084 [Hortaea werneckii]KAI7054787.1 hypothetical protein KC327_g18068 [Hortaea werneckii]
MRLLVALAASTAGVQGILQRRLPNHVDDSTFSLVNTSITTTSSSSSSSNNNNTTFLSKPQDQYTVLNGPNPGQIHISGTSPNRPRHQSPLVPHHLLPRGPLVVVTQHPNSGSSVVALALPTSTPVTLSRIRHPLRSFLAKQKAAFGDVTHIHTLDQYNENDPHSGDLDYLHNITSTK